MLFRSNTTQPIVRYWRCDLIKEIIDPPDQFLRQFSPVASMVTQLGTLEEASDHLTKLCIICLDSRVLVCVVLSIVGLSTCVCMHVVCVVCVSPISVVVLPTTGTWSSVCVAAVCNYTVVPCCVSM